MHNTFSSTDFATAAHPDYHPSLMSLYVLDTFGQLDPFVQREWLLTNGLGGFASSTVVGCNIRKYHGLLVAATMPPVGRMMTLSRLSEMLIIDGDPRAHELG